MSCFLSTRDAARHLTVSASWLEKARVRGDGPPFHRLGGRVVYSLEDLDTFVAARRVNSTAELRYA